MQFHAVIANTEWQRSRLCSLHKCVEARHGSDKGCICEEFNEFQNQKDVIEEMNEAKDAQQ